MVKRISCRVISTVAFSKTSAGLSSVEQMSNRQHERGSAAAENRLKHISNLADNLEAFNIDLGIQNGFPIGQVIDCYA